MTGFGRRHDDFLNRLPGSTLGRRRDDYQFDQSPLLLGVVAFDFRIKLLNPAWEKALGYGRADLLGRPFTAFVDYAEHIAVHRMLNPRLTGDDLIEFCLRCKDGSYKCFSWGRRAVPAEQVVLISGTDVTDRKKQELSASMQLHAKKGGAKGAE
jgi:PAS domain S-box-containing protein